MSDARKPLSYYMANALWYFDNPTPTSEVVSKATVESWLDRTKEMESHLKEKDELLREAAILLKRSKVGTALARQFENMTNPTKPSTIGVEHDKDSEALLSRINSHLNPH